jgi:hypothetical protein
MIRYMNRLLCLLLVAASQAALAEPGYRWEMQMEMNGMAIPGMGGGQSQCLPAGRNDTPGMDSTCTVLESRRSGNNYHWKANCDGTVSTGDFTYLGETAYKGTVTMVHDGERMVMKMSGKRLGKCEYSAPRVPVVAMPDTSETCDQAVREVEPTLVFGNNALCANRKKAFCARLDSLSPEAYGRVADRVGHESRQARVAGMVRMEDAIKGCNLSLADLGARQCRQAAGRSDCDFLDRYCPNERAKCVAAREFSGRAYSAPAASGGGVANPVGQGLNKLKGLFGF